MSLSRRPPRQARRARHRRRPFCCGAGGGEQAGQSSIEYTGVLAVIAVVLLLVGAVTGAGGITNAVGRGFQRALCVVGGGDCFATEIHACVARSSETSGRLGVKLTFVKLGGRFSLLRQELSDGTVDVTLIDGADVAPTAAVGARGGVRTGAGGMSTGALASAELLVRLGRRQVWHAADATAADRLVRDVKRDVAVRLATHAVPGIGTPVRLLAHLVGVDPPKLPPADEVGFLAGAKGSLKAELLGSATVAASLDASLGGSRNRATGRTTVVLKVDDDASGVLAGAAGGVTLSGSAGASVAVTFDRSGAPLDLAVSVAGTRRAGVQGSLSLPGRQTARAGGSERVERTTHLDLTRPDNRAAYDALVDGLTPPFTRSSAVALTGLARQLGTAGRQDVSRTASRSTTYGAEGEVALGARLGGDAEVTRTSVVLQDAWTRPAGGVWEQRTDCVDAAAAVPRDPAVDVR